MPPLTVPPLRPFSATSQQHGTAVLQRDHVVEHEVEQHEELARRHVEDGNHDQSLTIAHQRGVNITEKPWKYDMTGKY